MLGASGRVLVVLTLAAAAVTAEDASARAIRRTCRDGVIAQRTDRSGRPVVSCDVDGNCDGVCSFEVPVCGTSSCQAATFAVPVRSTLRERIAVEPGAAPTKLVLRCRPTPRIVHCVTVTTTTVGSSTTSPGHLPRPSTTTSTERVVGSSSTSTTMTSTSATVQTSITTSTLPIPCRTDVDCEGLSTACAVSFCRFDETCVQTCVCLTPEGDRTCSLDAATPCLTPAECPGPENAGCRVCYLNRCVTAPAPACFF